MNPGTPPSYLVFNIHTETDCTSQGGTIATDVQNGVTFKFCKMKPRPQPNYEATEPDAVRYSWSLSSNPCPSGWSVYRNFSAWSFNSDKQREKSDCLVGRWSNDTKCQNYSGLSGPDTPTSMSCSSYKAAYDPKYVLACSGNYHVYGNVHVGWPLDAYPGKFEDNNTSAETWYDKFSTFPTDYSWQDPSTAEWSAYYECMNDPPYPGAECYPPEGRCVSSPRYPLQSCRKFLTAVGCY